MLTNGSKAQSRRAWQNELGISFPASNPPHELWSPTTPSPTLDELKQRKQSELNGARNEVIDAGFDYSGIPVQTRKQDRENIQGLATAAQLAPDEIFTFRDADNTDHQLTAAQIIGMAMATMQHVQAQYIKSWALKDQADAATTADELDTITW